MASYFSPVVSHASSYYHRFKGHPTVQKITQHRYFKAVFNIAAISRLLVCYYFLNEAVTLIAYYKFNWIPAFPWFAVLLAPFAIPVIFNYRVNIFAAFLVFFAFVEAAELVGTQFSRWWQGFGLYINELMVKKLAMLGAALILIAHDQFNRDKGNSSSIIVGLLTTEEPKVQLNNRRSVVLLITRILLSVLFLYVGFTEIQRQLVTEVRHESHTHRRAFVPGDGHNNLWPKVAEFSLALPFVIGFQTKTVSYLLAICLILESFMFWTWWSSNLGTGYMIHSRQHFAVNLAVAGGLLLQRSFGAGKFSVDNYLSKKTD